MSDLRTASPSASADFPAVDVRRARADEPQIDAGRHATGLGCDLPPLDRLAELRPNAELLKTNHVVGFRGNSAVSRPFNLLRGQITAACEQHGYSVLGVVSAVPDEGKSFIAANLAAVLGRMPQLDVYLLDLDLRRPSVAGLFGINAEPGLDAWLQHGAPALSQIGRRVEGTNLAIFPSAPTTPDVVATLHGEWFEQLMGSLSRARSPSRIVLCDLPPVFVGDDTMAVARHLDAYIHVVGSGQSTTRQFEELGRLLKDTPCLGSVLNRYVGGPFDPYGYGRSSKAYEAYFSDQN